MGVWDKFTRLVKSNVNSMISKAENPEKTLNQLIIDMNQQLIEAKKAVASSIADEKRLERQLQNYKAESEKWNERALLSVKASESEPEKKEEYEELARESLKRVKELQPVMIDCEKQYDIQHENVERLKTTLRELQKKIEEAQRKKNILISRAKRAEAQQKMQEQISGMSNTSAFQAFEELEKKVDEMEIQADTLHTLGNATLTSSMEDKFKALESGTTSSVDSDLEELKRNAKLLEHKNSEEKSHNNEHQETKKTNMDPELESMMRELKNKANNNE